MGLVPLFIFILVCSIVFFKSKTSVINLRAGVSSVSPASSLDQAIEALKRLLFVAESHCPRNKLYYTLCGLGSRWQY